MPGHKKKTHSKIHKVREKKLEDPKKLLDVRREGIQSFKRRMDLKRRWHERLADFMTESFGTIHFLILNVFLFIAWILINVNIIPGIQAFDPYPFNFLTMVVSLEAIVLSIIVLMSQNRESEIADLREEIELRINVRAEQEITKILNMLDEIHDHVGLPNGDDEELVSMKQKTNLEEIEEEIRKENNF